jgi:hypothetical protein
MNNRRDIYNRGRDRFCVYSMLSWTHASWSHLKKKLHGVAWLNWFFYCITWFDFFWIRDRPKKKLESDFFFLPKCHFTYVKKKAHCLIFFPAHPWPKKTMSHITSYKNWHNHARIFEIYFYFSTF